MPSWAGKLGEQHTLDIPTLGAVSETALTRDVEIAMGEGGLPNTFVPGRNLIFLTFAAALAYRRGIKHIVTGVCETDYSGYPDCRDDTIKALQVAINLGMERRFVLHTPLMWRDKAATWTLAHELGGDALVELIRKRLTFLLSGGCGIPAMIGALDAANAPPAACAPMAGTAIQRRHRRRGLAMDEEQRRDGKALFSSPPISPASRWRTG